MGILILAYIDSDRSDVMALWTLVFNYTARHNDPKTAIRQKLAVDRDLLQVATSGDRVIGTVMGGYEGHPDHRRRGVATQLVKSVELALLQ